MSLRETLRLFTSRLQEAGGPTCVGEKEVRAQRDAAAADFAHLNCWHPVRYPGEVSLPIFLLPVVPPMPEKLHAATAALHEAMRQEGVGEAQFRIGSRIEKRQTHLWFANIRKHRHLLIGQITFASEECSVAAPDPVTAPAEPGVLRLRPSVKEGRPLVSRWWLHHVWISPAYRGQRTLSHSLDYLNEWHPSFQAREPGAALAGALKNHPEHVFDASPHWS